MHSEVRPLLGKLRQLLRHALACLGRDEPVKVRGQAACTHRRERHLLVAGVGVGVGIGIGVGAGDFVNVELVLGESGGVFRTDDVHMQTGPPRYGIVLFISR